MNPIKEIININDDETKKLKEYVNILLNYNNKINLIGKSTIEDIWNRHILDSLQLMKFINNKNIKLADFGSGAGLPGIVLSIMGVKEVDLFEKSPRKCEFLRKVTNNLNNKIVIYNENILNINNEKYDIITSRALGNLNLLLSFSEKFKKNNTELLFLKGRKIYQEIEEAEKYWNIRYELFDSITSSEGKIIKITNFVRKSK